MARKRRDRLEQIIDDALAPGAFFDYHDMWTFLGAVEAAKAKIGALVEKGQAATAVGFYESFIAGCYEKLEEIDDSEGGFGDFVAGLLCDWIKARQAAKADPDETAGILLSWMEDDDYGYSDGLDEEVIEALGKAGLVAFENAVRRRWMSGPKRAQLKDSYRYRCGARILKGIHAKRRDLDAYVGICEEAGELSSRDCEVLAEICLKRRQCEDALRWVDRGLELEKEEASIDGLAYDLPGVRRQILQKLGRRDDAIASAWEEYRGDPSPDSFEELMKYVPKAERHAWRAKALAAMEHAPLDERIGIFVKAREWNGLAELVQRAERDELMGISHFTTEPAAQGLAKAHPRPAAKLHAAMGLRILAAKMGRYYDAALDNFEAARNILQKEGMAGAWDELVDHVREKHSRKSGFMPRFERLFQASRTRSSSVDRAGQKWGRKAQRQSGG
ncbi:MAG: DUF6880 family protein [Candidatus Krumholzibacteriia bacterium]